MSNTQKIESGEYSSWSEPEEGFYDEDRDQDYTDGYDDDDDGYYDDEDDVYYYYDNKGNMCSDVYGDFSVRAKAPPAHTRSRPFPAQKPMSKSSKPRSTNSTSPSDQLPRHDDNSVTTTLTLPPEVLHLIFSYLDNATLCHGISYASHQFNAIAKHYIECLWTLGTQRDEDILLEKLRLGKVNVLRIRYSTSPPEDSGRSQPFDKWDQAWKRFRDIVTQPINITEGATDGALHEQSVVDRLSVATETMAISAEKDQAPCLLWGVRKLIMDGGDLWTPGFLPTLLPFTRSIHKLVLNPWGWSQTRRIQSQWPLIYEIPLHSVLNACPSIRTLVIHGAASLCLNKEAPATSTQGTGHTFQLSRFILRNVTATQETLGNFLSSCPQLVSFKAKNIHIRTQGTPHHHLLNTPSLAVEPLLQRAAFLCPNLVDLSVIPDASAPINTFEHLLAKFAQYFPQTKHLVVQTPLCLDSSWVPTPTVAKFLAQVTSLGFSDSATTHSAQNLDRLLRHTHALERLCSACLPYSRKRKTEYPKQQYISLKTSWRCLHLREIELSVPDVARQEGVFRYLRYACPNVEHLTLYLFELRIGQAEPAVQVTYETYKHRALGRNWCGRLPLHRLWRERGIYTARREVCTEYWTKKDSTLWALGGLLRLETLVLRCQNVKGVLCPKDFKFMQIRRGGRGGSGDERAFCPRLKELQVISTPVPRCGLTKEEPLENRTVFMTILKSMRPGVDFRF
ncbi:hypothetical protein BGZ80_005650 [Entomortierella chlamydospora]|uniref:F-box domain-containing protein n=1 Tax=Entomortierella chlamydospora TaxID=101097 RepID=A0A9P6MJ33_9FUNG|nr:hypothetical protein BGZ79_004396 [Entomortierella chlamydospora]KAG0004243.1 hypothetical protein BGZ80_005650 [Entomortierella chlamydospora]